MKKTQKKRPPCIARWIISRLSQYEKEHALADAMETDYLDIRDQHGAFLSWIWYWFYAIGILFHYIKFSLLWSMIMFKNYLKIALRNMRKHKVYSFINVSGLAVSIACCLMILMHIRFETSYDNYHRDADRVYRLGIDINMPSFKRVFAPVSYFEAPYLKENFPQVEAVTRLWDTSGILVRRGDRVFYENDVYTADNDIFDVLTFPLKQGDPETALNRPGTLVVSESVGRKYFGNESPTGQTIQVGGRVCVVTGVMADPPKNTHLKIGMIASMIGDEVPEWARRHWYLNVFYTYVKFHPDVDVQSLLPKIETGANSHKDIKEGQKFTYFLQPLKDIHLFSHIHGELAPPGNPTYLFIFGVIAGLILIIAGINFINLSTARAAARSKEVGLRKIVGAFRKQLIFQFLGESILTTLLAVFLACLISGVFLPFYSHLTEIPYSLKDFVRLDLLLAMIGILFFSGIIAGSYPAFYLSGLRPIASLNRRQGNLSKRNGLRRVLVVGQFIVSFIIITGAIVVSQQIRYMKNKNLGFEKEQKIVIPVRQGAKIGENFETVKAEFLRNSGVTGVTMSSGVPGRLAEGANARLVGEADDMTQWMYYLFVDTDFFREYGITLAAGRTFQKEQISDSRSSFLINEAAVKKFGWHDPTEALRKTLWSGYGGNQGEIIGVVKDFHFFGLQREIGPVIMSIRPDVFRFITLTLSTNNIGRTLASVKNTWESLFPGIPIDYSFIDTYFDRFYREEEKVAALVRVFGILAIAIACFGILGLTAHTTQSRTKEIGIRKVVGASVTRITVLLSGEFVKWVLFANLIALPAAYYILNKWLAGFAYRTEFSLWFLLIPSVLTVGFAAFTVSYHTIKAAAANPVDSLRYE
ncbi:MAG: ABC transporter permease [Candidatus Aminicenantes bacterium]|nr:ABC transporter permease [Candidatus Aminicenantes bacterium]